MILNSRALFGLTFRVGHEHKNMILKLKSTFLDSPLGLDMGKTQAKLMQVDIQVHLFLQTISLASLIGLNFSCAGSLIKITRQTQADFGSSIIFTTITMWMHLKPFKFLEIEKREQATKKYMKNKQTRIDLISRARDVAKLQ